MPDIERHQEQAMEEQNLTRTVAIVGRRLRLELV